MDPGFFNENENRFYPFVVDGLGSGSLALKNMIVDFGAIMGPEAGYVDGEHIIYLSEVSRAGSVFTFRFESTAPGLFGSQLTFTRDLADDRYTTSFSTNDAEFDEAYDSLSPEAEIDCDGDVLWSGFLVTGSLDLLADLIDPGDTLTAGEDYQLEPDTVQNLAGTFVSTVNVANNDRTRVDAPSGCLAVIWAHPTDIIFIQSQCLRGPLRIMPGYNAVVRQSDRDNMIELSAEAGAGAGQVCDEVPLFDAEAPPDGDTLLSGGTRCNEVVRSINGLGGPIVNLIGGRGVTITPDPENNKLIVDIDLSDLAICADFEGESD